LRSLNVFSLTSFASWVALEPVINFPTGGAVNSLEREAMRRHRATQMTIGLTDSPIPPSAQLLPCRFLPAEYRWDCTASYHPVRRKGILQGHFFNSCKAPGVAQRNYSLPRVSKIRFLRGHDFSRTLEASKWPRCLVSGGERRWPYAACGERALRPLA
jgi:hypothetical protein